MFEKQGSIDIYRQTFQKTELNEQLVSIDPFKEAILTFKLNHSDLSENEHKQWIKENIVRIILDEKDIKMDLKKLQFRLE